MHKFGYWRLAPLCGTGLALAACTQSIKTADLIIYPDTSVKYTIVHVQPIPKPDDEGDEEAIDKRDEELGAYVDRKVARIRKACGVDIDPFVSRIGEHNQINIVIKGRVDRFYGLKRVYNCLPTEQNGSVEIKKHNGLFYRSYLTTVHFNIGSLVNSDDGFNGKRFPPEEISIDVPGEIDPDTIKNRSRGLGVTFATRVVGDSVLEIVPKHVDSDAEIAAHCKAKPALCDNSGKGDVVIDFELQSFEPKFDLPGVMGILVTLTTLGGALFSRKAFVGLFRRVKAKFASKSVA